MSYATAKTLIPTIRELPRVVKRQIVAAGIDLSVCLLQTADIRNLGAEATKKNIFKIGRPSYSAYRVSNASSCGTTACKAFYSAATNNFFLQ